jgi:hypothetical protein
MFRAKTVKRGNKKTNPVTGPITPASNSTGNASASVNAPVNASVNVSASTSILDNANAPVVVAPVKSEITTESMLSALLDAESKNAVHRPWLRLERGIRMRLLRAFVEKQVDLNPGERVDLLAALVDALDKKLLNSKSQISYNQESGEIIDIHSLKVLKGSSGKTTFRVEPPNRNTKKAKRQISGSDSD